MKAAMSLRYLTKSLSFETAAKALSDVDIKLLNYTPQTAEELRLVLSACEKYGLEVYQTHAPFNRYKGAPIDVHKKSLLFSLEATAEMGAKYIVAHADEFDCSLPFSKENANKYTYEYFAPLVEEAERLSIKVAFENTFNDIPSKPRYCTNAKELNALIAAFNTSNVCVCWDTGHAAVAYNSIGADQFDAIKFLGKKIECTHIHDNHLTRDEHLTPFEGLIDWRSCMDALSHTSAEVLCFEPVYGDIAECDAAAYAKQMYSVAEKLNNLKRLV